MPIRPSDSLKISSAPEFNWFLAVGDQSVEIDHLLSSIREPLHQASFKDGERMFGKVQRIAADIFKKNQSVLSFEVMIVGE